MKTLFDTSVLVAAIVESHSRHLQALPWLQQAKAEEAVDNFFIASHIHLGIDYPPRSERVQQPFLL